MTYEALTTLDKKIIADYIYTYGASSDDNAYLNVCPTFEKIYNNLPHILRFWSKEKQFLYKLFGEKLILSKPIEIEVPSANYDNICHRFYLDHDDYARYIYKFKHRIFTACYTGEIQNTTSSVEKDLTSAIYKIVSNNALITNQLSKKISFVYKDKTYTFNKGMKATRALDKIRTLLNFASEEEHQEFCIEHSQLLNKKKFKGNLCLSIHPLDYMTMSDNHNNWSSCMSWYDDGCYSSGTIEMMNSKSVVVAYLVSTSNEFKIGEYAWNSKKWRELFIINEDLIFGVKGYPYPSNVLEAEVLTWLRQLAHTNLTQDYDETIYQTTAHKYIAPNAKATLLQFETDAMYNDCLSVEHQFILRSADVFEHSKYIVGEKYCYNYSGAHNCMYCGEMFSWNPDGGEKDRFCEGCQTHGIICPECGNTIYDLDDIQYFVNRDEPYCTECYDNHCVTEAIYDRDGYYDEDLIAFDAYWAQNDFYNTYYAAWNSKSYYKNTSSWSKKLLIDKFREDGDNIYYIFPEDCTIAGLQYFYGITCFEEYKKAKGNSYNPNNIPEEWRKEWNIPTVEVNNNEK